MKTPQNLLVVLAGGVMQKGDGTWGSTELSEAGAACGAAGSILRVYATAELVKEDPSALVYVSGGVGYESPETSSKRPLLADILAAELAACGIIGVAVYREVESNSTYQQLQELERYCSRYSIGNIRIVTNRYHVPRVKAMLEIAFTALGTRDTLEIVSAEGVLIQAEPARWKELIEAEYGSPYMKARIEQEERGAQEIYRGTYTFK